jgi:gliding motility-associated-like protein
LLTSKPKPTAAFQSFNNNCGIETKNLGIVLTGTKPWSITYTTTPSSGSPTTQTISNIQSSPYFLNVTPTQQTAYQITSVSDKFCSNTYATSNASNTISIYPKPSITPISDTICSGTNSFQLRFSTTGSPNNYSISTGQRALTSFVNVSDANITSNNISITIPNGSAAGEYDFVVSAKNSNTGCISDTKNITLKIVAPTTMELSASKNLFCAGDSITLYATTAGFSSYVWTSNQGHTITNIANPKVKVNVATTFTVTGTDINGCTSTASLTLTPAAGSSVSISPTSTTICFGSSVALVANGGSNYTWSPSTGLSTTTGSTVIASPTATTTYTVTSTNDAGCVSTSQVVVTVSNQNVNISPSSATMCEGGNVTLTASGGSNYTWYPSTGLSTTTGSTVVANPANTTTYFVRSVDAGGCVKIASVVVTVSRNPVNTSTSTPNNLIFCTQGTSSFPLTVDVTESGTTRSWAYSSTAGGPYTYFTQDTTVGSILFDMSNASVNNSTLTISGYGASAYGGPRYFRLRITGATCSYFYDITITDTKGTQPAAPIADKSSVCINEGTTLRAGKVSLGSSIQWQSSTTGATNSFTNITGATSDTLATGSLTTNTYYRIAITGATASCNDESNGTLVNITPALSANTISVSSTCTDPKVSSVTITGSTVTGADYQWQSSTTSSSTGFADILGQQSKDYTLPTNVVANTTWYRRVVSTNACSASPSSTVVLYAPISNNQISSASNTYCDSASSVILTGTSPAGGDANYVYKWQRSTTSAELGFTDIASSNTQNITIAKIYANTWYRRIVTAGTCIDTSEAYKVSIYTSSTVSVTANTSICAGSSVQLSASGATSYSWSPSTGLSSTIGSYVIANPAVTTTYTVTGTNANGCAKTAQVTVTVNASPSTPVLSTSSKTVCSSDGSFDISSLIQSGTGVEWYTVPEINASFKINNTVRSSSGTFYAFAKNGTCYSANYATLDLTFVNTSKPDVSATNINICSPATFNLTTLQPANRVGVTYRWFTTNDRNLSNEVSNASTAGTGTYYLFAYSSAGNCFSPASNAVNVVVNSITSASVTTTTLNVCSANSIDLNDYNATAGNNIYNWYTVASNPTINDLVLNPQSVSTSGTYYLYATNASGCMGPASPGLTVNFNTSPSANIGTVNSYCGQAVRTISVSTNATSALYRWQVSTNNAQSWTNLSNNSIYSGVTTSTLSINNTTGLDGYLYRVNVQNSTNTCNTFSESVVLVEEVPMTIATQPSNKLIGIGDTTILSVAISGSPTADYQWKVSTNSGASYTNLVDNAKYVGANSNPLIIIGAPVTFNGYLYKCEISNNCDTVLTNAAQLLVSNTPNQAPIAGNDTKTINEDTPTTGSLTANDSDPDDALTYSVINNTDKGTLVLNPNGTYSYTPNANATGTDTLIYKVCDSGTPTKCDTARLVITITPINDRPIANSDTIRRTTNEDEPIVICVPATDVEGNRIDVSNVSSLDKGTSSSTSGLDSCFTYTPNPNVNGQDTVRVIITDGNGGFDTVQIIITITPVNDPPVAVNDTKLTNEDQIATGTLATNDSDPENNTLSFSILTNTKKGTITVNANGNYSYVPNANYFGTDTLIYKVCDNGTPSKCDTAQLVITINPVNDAPKVPSDTIRRTTNEDQPIVICVAATDAEKNRIDISSVSALNKGTASSTSGIDSCFTFTPTPNINGLDTISVIINDGQGGFDTLYVIINILPINDPPIAVDDTKTVNEDGFTTGTISNNDTDPENDLLFFSVLDFTDKGTIVLNPNGTYTYTTNANVTGTDTLIYLVCDNGSPSKCDTGMLVITINPVNDPPVAINDARTINEDQVATGTVANNDTDPENNALTFSVVTNTSKGNIQLNANGTYTYTPNLNANGTDTLTYKVCDNGTPSKCDTAILVITINPINDDPKSLSDTIRRTTPEDEPIVICIPALDVEGNTIDVTDIRFQTLGTTSSTVGTDSCFTYTPNSNVNGIDTIRVIISDGKGGFDTVQVIITITPVNDPPKALSDTIRRTTPEDEPIVICIPAIDNDKNRIDISAINNLTLGTSSNVSSLDSCFTYTPNPNTTGLDTIQVIISDGKGGFDTVIVIINITPVNDPPQAANDTIRRTTPEDEPIVICIEAIDIDKDKIDVHNISALTLGIVSNLSGVDSCFTYFPNPNINGIDTFRVIISDGKGGFDTIQVILTITPVNDKPIAINDQRNLLENTPVNGTVATNDSDIDNDPLSFTLLNSTTRGSIIFNSDGTYTYTPSTNFFGIDSARYVVCDNGTPSLCDTAMLYLTIASVNDKPIAVNDSAITEINKSVRIDVANNDFDSDNDPLTFVYAAPRHGKFVVISNGVIDYNPKFNFIGKDSLKYIVCDQAVCDTATVYIEVKGKLNPTIGVALAVSEPLILTPETYNITYTITVKNYGDVDLSNVRITEDLKMVFPTPTEFNILEITEPTGFAINPNFDGVTNFELLDSTNSTLLIGESKQIELKIFIKPNTTVVNYSNSVTAFGTGNLILSDSIVSDISVAGLDPDPDGDGVPNETGTTETQLKMFVPNGFSPDGDGINDAFVIRGIENYPNNTLTIFNRWGNKVYEESPYKNNWTGNSKNASGIMLGEGVLPIGTYFYIIDFGVEGVKAQTGFVVIKK